MIIKVCGMRDAQNIAQVKGLGVDMLGFIFYPPSPRYVGEQTLPKTNGARVGVFVNENVELIEELAAKQSLTHIQLHGEEAPEVCQALKAKGYTVIKNISVANAADFQKAEQYDSVVDLFLFDTKCEGYGGSGVQFDWSLLQNYGGSKPFLLSGGVDETMARSIKSISHPRFAGVDLNSRFEQAAAIKNIEKLEIFINELR